MRLLALRVENLGPLEKIDLALKPVTVLTGPNEQGKTFLGIDALSVLRFGSTRGIPVGESHALIRNGAKGWSVEADVRPTKAEAGAPPFTLRRTRSSKPDEATLAGALGDARVWAALLNVRHFLGMAPADRKTLVADLLARDTNDLLRTLEEMEAPADILAAVREGNLRKAHRIAEENRRACDRAAKEAQAIIGAGVEDPEVQTKAGPKPVSAVALTAIDTALAAARNRHAEGLKAQAAADRRKETIAAADAAREELAKMGGGTPWTNEEAARLADLGIQRSDLGGRASTASAERLAAMREADALRERHKASSKGCPTCGQELPEPARKALLAKAKEHEDLALQRQATADKAHADIRTLDVEAKGLREKQEAWDRERTYRLRLEERIKAADKAKAEPEPPALEPLAAEVKRIEAVRDIRVRFDARSEQVKRSQARIEEMAKGSASWESIERLVTPDRLDDEGTAIARINEAAAEYAPAIMEGPAVQVTPGWEVTYRGMRVELASDAAAIRVGLVLALSLSRLSGVKAVFVDRLEALTEASRAKVVNLLGRLVESGEVETAILASVRQEKPPPASLPEWMGRLWVEGGTAVPC